MSLWIWGCSEEIAEWRVGRWGLKNNKELKTLEENSGSGKRQRRCRAGRGRKGGGRNTEAVEGWEGGGVRR